MGGNLPFMAACEEDEPDDIRCGDFGPWLANKSGSSRGAGPETRRKGTAEQSRRTYVTGKRPPTEKQILFARAISTTLDVDLPEELTRQSLFLFIRDNRPKYDETIKARKECRAKQARMRREREDPDPIDVDEDWYQMTGEGLDPATGGFDDNY